MAEFYAGQTDYIAKLNALALGGALAIGSLVTSGVANRVLYEAGAPVLVAHSASFTFDGSALQVGNQQFTPWSGSAAAGVGASLFYGTLTGAGQVGIYSILIQSATGTSSGYSVQSRVDTAAAAFTLTEAAAFLASNPSIGAGSTITTYNGFYCQNLSLAGASGQIGFHSALTPGTGKYNFFADGAADNFLRGRLGIGTGAPANVMLHLTTIAGDTTGTSQFGINLAHTTSSGATSEGVGVYSAPITAAVAHTQTSQYSFYANGAAGAGSTVTNYTGFYAASVAHASQIIGFSGAIAAGTSRFNLYMGGSAWNYIAGNIGLGAVAPAADRFVYLNANALTTATQTGYLTVVTGTAAATSDVIAYYANPGTAAAAFSCTQVTGFMAEDASKGAGSTITTLVGFHAKNLTQGTTNIGYRGVVASGANKWNLYMDGTASNHLAGTTLIGSTQNDTRLGQKLGLVGTANFVGMTISTYSATAGEGCIIDMNRSKSASIGTLTAVASGDQIGNISARGADGSAFNTSSYIAFYVDGTVAGAQVPGRIEFYTAGAAGATAIALNINKSQQVLAVAPLGGLGYGTGAGGTQTQATSKTQGVTLDKVCGQITMNAAALAAGAKATFTLTNSSIATTDGVVVWIDSGGTANAYRASVAAVGAGTCAITVENITAGSLSEACVIGFAVLKAVTS